MPLWLRHWLQVGCKSNRMARTAGAFAATALRCRCGCASGNEQRSHVISSFLHVVHAVHTARASRTRVAGGEGLTVTCGRSGRALPSQPEQLRCRCGCAIGSRSRARATAWHVQQAPSLPRPMACAEAVSAATSSAVTSSAPSLHVVHAVHANGAQQQAAGALMWPTAALHQPRLQSGRQAAALLVCQPRSLVAAAFGPATGWLSRISSPPWQ